MADNDKRPTSTDISTKPEKNISTNNAPRRTNESTRTYDSKVPFPKPTPPKKGK